MVDLYGKCIGKYTTWMGKKQPSETSTLTHGHCPPMPSKGHVETTSLQKKHGGRPLQHIFSLWFAMSLESQYRIGRLY